MSLLLEKFSQMPLAVGDAGFDALRRHARKVLMQHGFPHRKTEAWKYTPLSLLEHRQWSIEPKISTAPAIDLPFSADVIRIHNGQLDHSVLRQTDGVEIRAMRADQVDTSSYADDSPSDAFAWLNLARMQQAWSIVIDRSLSKPLVLVFTSDDEFAQAVHPRLRVELAEGASATLLEWQPLGGCGLINSVLDVVLKPKAELNHVVHRKCGETALIERTHVQVGHDANYAVHVLDLGGGLTRQDLKVDLTAEDASTRVNGVAALNDRQLVDYHTAIQHQVGPSHSHEDFRILADGHSMGVFNGRIHMLQDADHSHSDMNTANLLLSEHARINTKPELEIHAEEVTASHGATIGQLEESARFYLRSRGLNDQQALALLKLGFAAAVFDDLQPDGLKDWLIEQLKTAL